MRFSTWKEMAPARVSGTSRSGRHARRTFHRDDVAAFDEHRAAALRAVRHQRRQVAVDREQDHPAGAGQAIASVIGSAALSTA